MAFAAWKATDRAFDSYTVVSNTANESRGYGDARRTGTQMGGDDIVRHRRVADDRSLAVWLSAGDSGFYIIQPFSKIWIGE